MSEKKQTKDLELEELRCKTEKIISQIKTQKTQIKILLTRLNKLNENNNLTHSTKNIIHILEKIEDLENLSEKINKNEIITKLITDFKENILTLNCKIYELKEQKPQNENNKNIIKEINSQIKNRKDLLANFEKILISFGNSIGDISYEFKLLLIRLFCKKNGIKLRFLYTEEEKIYNIHWTKWKTIGNISVFESEGCDLFDDFLKKVYDNYLK